MMLVVTFVSLMVHVYTIGYMADDPGYTRFFSYISLFTFAMLMLVMSNNFVQLFFGWEAVGLVSYLLIGFWYTRPTAIYANLKAFLANRVGDFGFVLGIGLILAHFGTLDYAPVFAKASTLAGTTLNLWGTEQWSLMTVICICLFIGAMGKSAQVPLHVWLPGLDGRPDAHLRADPCGDDGHGRHLHGGADEPAVRAVGHRAVVRHDHRRDDRALHGLSRRRPERHQARGRVLDVVAVGLHDGGAGGLGVFRGDLSPDDACVLQGAPIPGAGSVIIALHHEQDLRRMGGLRKYMPITYWTAVVGSLALAGIPPFAGFFSKDAIIEAVHASSVTGHGYAYFAVMAGVFITAFYSFRMLFLAFHGEERFADDAHGPDATHADDHAAHGDDHGHDHGPPKESPWVVTVPLILLAIPSVYAGWAYIEPMVIGTYFGDSIVIRPEHAAMATLREEWHGIGTFVQHGLLSLPFWLAVAGIVSAWYCYLINPALPEKLKRAAGPIYTLLDQKYYFDRFNDWFFAGGARAMGAFLSTVGDRTIIDGFFVNGSARVVGWTASLVRQMQSGFVYHYAFTMILGVLALLLWWTRGQ
jgi:NADH-quinone oxidoreductase subunit L